MSQDLSSTFQLNRKTVVLESTSAILDTLERDHIRSALFGSIAIAAYSKQFYRLPNDIDIIVPRDSSNQVRDLLCGLGFQHKRGFHGPHYSEFYRAIRGTHLFVHTVFGYSSPLQGQISVDRELWKLEYCFSVALSNRRQLNVEGRFWYAVPPEELIITSLFVENRLKRLTDLLVLLDCLKTCKLDLDYLRDRLDCTKDLAEIIVLRLRDAFSDLSKLLPLMDGLLRSAYGAELT